MATAPGASEDATSTTADESVDGQVADPTMGAPEAADESTATPEGESEEPFGSVGGDEGDLGGDVGEDSDGDDTGTDGTPAETVAPDGGSESLDEAGGTVGTLEEADDLDAAMTLDGEIQPRAGAMSCAANTVYSVRGDGKLYEIVSHEGTNEYDGSFSAPVGASDFGLIGQWMRPDGTAYTGGVNGLGIGKEGNVAYAVPPLQNISGTYYLPSILKWTPTPTGSGSFTQLTLGSPGFRVNMGSVAAGGVNLLNDAYYFGSYMNPAPAGVAQAYEVYKFDESKWTAANPSAAVSSVGWFRLEYPANNTDLAFDGSGNLYVVNGAVIFPSGPPKTQIYSISAAELAAAEASGNPNFELTPAILAGSSNVNVTGETVGNVPGRPDGVNGISFDGRGGVYLSNNISIALFDSSSWEPVIAAPGNKGLPIPGINLQTTALQSADLGGCASPPHLELKKIVNGHRVQTDDEFVLSIAGTVDGVPNTEITTATTDGPATGLQNVFAGPVPVAADSEYTINEAFTREGAGEDYDSAWYCTWANGPNDQLGNLGSGTGTKGTVTIPDEAGAAVECVFENTPKPATVKLYKAWTLNGSATTAVIAEDLGFTADPYLDPAGELLDLETEESVALDWEQVREGFAVGDVVEVGETNASTEGNETHPGCYLSSSTLTGTPLASQVTLAPNTDGTWPADPWKHEATLVAGANEFKVTNNIVCEQSLTLVKNVVNPDGVVTAVGGPADWTLTATSSTTGVGPFSGRASPENLGELSGSVELIVPVGEYTLSEAADDDLAYDPAVYVPSEWSCSVNGLDAEDGDTVTLADGQSAACEITNSTAELTVLKLAEGALTAGQFQVSATGPEELELPVLRNATGSATASDANSILVRPGAEYALSEAAKDGSTPAYVQRAFEKYVPSEDQTGTPECPATPTPTSFADPACWTAENVSADSVAVAAGERGIYRFVNYTPEAPTLPMTGGQGAAMFAILGGGLLLGATGLVALARRRRPAEQI